MSEGLDVKRGFDALYNKWFEHYTWLQPKLKVRIEAIMLSQKHTIRPLEIDAQTYLMAFSHNLYHYANPHRGHMDGERPGDQNPYIMG